jgi:hypothetical protein
MPVLGFLQFFERNGHCHKNDEHGDGCSHEHDSTLEPSHEERQNGGVNPAPAVVGEIDSGFGVAARVTHQLEQQVGIVR